MSNKPRSDTKGRRAFLTQLAAVGGATATMAVAGRAAAAPGAEETPVTAPESKGYRVTPHISAYYDKARF